MPYELWDSATGNLVATDSRPEVVIGALRYFVDGGDPVEDYVMGIIDEHNRAVGRVEGADLLSGTWTPPRQDSAAGEGL